VKVLIGCWPWSCLRLNDTKSGRESGRESVVKAKAIGGRERRNLRLNDTKAYRSWRCRESGRESGRGVRKLRPKRRP